MGFAVPNALTVGTFSSAGRSINNFTRKHPLIASVAIVALSILAYNALFAVTFSGLVIGSIFTFTAFTSANHIFTNREDFALLVKNSFRALKATSFEERQQIDLHSEEIRNRIASR